MSSAPSLASSPSQVLSCLICFGRLTDPRICPKCSCLACLSCLSHWLAGGSGCPCCRTPLDPTQLVACRFIKDIYEEMDRLVVDSSYVDHCKHVGHESNVLHYYCLSCRESICSDCALMENTHKQHEIKKLTSVYEVKAAEIHAKLAEWKFQIHSTEMLHELLDANIGHCEAAQKEAAREAAEAVKAYERETAAMMETRVSDLSRQRGALVHFHDLLKNVYRLLFSQLDARVLKKSELIQNTEEIIKSMEANINQEITNIHKEHATAANGPSSVDFISLIRQESSRFFAALPASVPPSKEKLTAALKTFRSHLPRQLVSSSFPNDFVPEFLFHVYRLYDFRDPADGRPHIVYSDGLAFMGKEFKLKIYPTGNGVAKGSFLSVFLELSSDRTPTPLVSSSSALHDDASPISYEYRIDLARPSEPTQPISRSSVSSFEVSEVWGWNKFAPLADGALTEYIHKDDPAPSSAARARGGYLEFRFSVRPKSIRDHARIERRYRSELERENRDLTMRLAELNNEQQNMKEIYYNMGKADAVLAGAGVAIEQTATSQRPPEPQTIMNSSSPLPSASPPPSASSDSLAVGRSLSSPLDEAAGQSDADDEDNGIISPTPPLSAPAAPRAFLSFSSSSSSSSSIAPPSAVVRSPSSPPAASDSERHEDEEAAPLTDAIAIASVSDGEIDDGEADCDDDIRVEDAHSAGDSQSQADSDILSPVFLSRRVVDPADAHPVAAVADASSSSTSSLSHTGPVQLYAADSRIQRLNETRQRVMELKRRTQTPLKSAPQSSPASSALPGPLSVSSSYLFPDELNELRHHEELTKQLLQQADTLMADRHGAGDANQQQTDVDESSPVASSSLAAAPSPARFTSHSANAAAVTSMLWASRANSGASPLPRSARQL